jgi:hypothetical protein
MSIRLILCAVPILYFGRRLIALFLARVLVVAEQFVRVRHNLTTLAC